MSALPADSSQPPKSPGPLFSSHAVLISAFPDETLMSVYELSIWDEHEDPQIHRKGEPFKKSGGIYKALKKELYVHFVLAEAHKILEKLETTVPGKPQTVPVFFVSSNDLALDEGNYAKVVDAVNNVYYTDGSRFSMGASFPGDEQCDANLGKEAIVNKGEEILRIKFKQTTTYAAIFNSDERPHIYRYRRVNNKYFNLPHKVDKVTHDIQHTTLENDVTAAYALKKPTHLLISTKTQETLKNITSSVGNPKWKVYEQLPNDEEGRLDEVCKYLSEATRYGVILDAGSSGTRIFIYRWIERFDYHNNPVVPSKEEMDQLPLTNSTIDAGISSLLGSTTSANQGPDAIATEASSKVANYLTPLLEEARKELEVNKEPPSRVPLYMLATGGMRSLKVEKYEWYKILTEAIKTFLNASGFLEPTYKTISGQDEGILGWVAANFKAGRFQRARGVPPKSTTGFVEMGGQTAQIAFQPSPTNEEKQEYRGPLTRVVLGAHSYDVFTKSWPMLGADAMWRLHEKKLSSSDDFKNAANPEDPCWPRGHEYQLDGKTVVGTGNLIESTKEAFTLLPCDDGACRAGSHCVTRKQGGCLLSRIPGLGFSQMGQAFTGASVFYYATNGAFGKSGGNLKSNYDLVNLWIDANTQFSQKWEDIKPKELGKAYDRLQYAFFKASLIMATLHMGFGVPMPPHASDCVNLAMTWYHKADMAVNEGQDPAGDLIHIMRSMLKPPPSVGPSTLIDVVLQVLNLDLTAQLSQMVDDIFKPLLSGDTAGGKRAIDEWIDTGDTFLGIITGYEAADGFAGGLLTSFVLGASRPNPEDLKNIKDKIMGLQVALRSLKNHEHLPDNRPLFESGKLNNAWTTVCFDFITRCMSMMAPGDAGKDAAVQEKYQPIDVSWTLGRMVLCSAYSNPEERTFESWGARGASSSVTLPA